MAKVKYPKELVNIAKEYSLTPLQLLRRIYDAVGVQCCYRIVAKDAGIYPYELNKLMDVYFIPRRKLEWLTSMRIRRI